MAQMCITLADTTAAPYPVPTFSSISTVGTGKAVQMAAEHLRNHIINTASHMLDVEIAKISISGDRIMISDAPEHGTTLAEVAQYLEANGISNLCESALEWAGEAPNIFLVITPDLWNWT